MAKKTLWIIIGYVICFFPLNAYATAILEDIEFQERCEKRSGEWFEKRQGSGYAMINGVMIMSHYKNHYNKKMKKCFILTNTTYFDTMSNEESLRNRSLCDVNENISYGSFLITGSKTEGKLLGRVVGAENEWELLVKPYMAD